MKKKIVAAFCLAMVMTVGGCSGAVKVRHSWRLFRSLRAVLTLRKRIPRRNPHHPQLLPMPQMHRAAEIFLRWIRT
mgnify:CR=1 FL=1